MDKITDYIYLGNVHDAKKIDVLRQNDIKVVLNVAVDIHHHPPIEQEDITFLKIGLVDGPGNSLVSFASAVAALSTCVDLKQKVLIHCHEGVSRSPAVVAAYLASKAWRTKSHLAMIDDQLNKLYQVRSKVGPNEDMREIAALVLENMRSS